MNNWNVSFTWLFICSQAPDLDDVKESVRQGVTKVAGKLSNMATNVIASLQVLE